MLLALSPGGTPHLEPRPVDEEPALAPEVATRIAMAFERGHGHGVLHLGAVEVGVPLPVSFALFGELARKFLTCVCALPDLEERRDKLRIPPPAGELARLAETVPPMTGAEYASLDVLCRIWVAVEDAFRQEVADYSGSVQAYLAEKSPVWNVVGRVCFHLAENKLDEAHPFAFLATYSTRVTAGTGNGATVKHLPLGQALRDFAGTKSALLSLLLPVQKAATTSSLVRELVDSGDIFHPLAWTARQAYRLLQEIPILESAGVVVRVPDWWKRRARPRVNVTIGGGAAAGLGLDAILDFRVDVSLDGERLTPADLEALLAKTDGLALVRGQWVELDGERLGQVLSHWRALEKRAGRAGLTFVEGMRLLAGLELSGPGSGHEDDGLADTAREWSFVSAGAWLRDLLERLRDPEAIELATLGDELRATLRGYQASGVRWLALLTELGLGACLADDMGLGKTLQVIGLLLWLRRHSQSKARSRLPHLLVVPASLLGNWESEVARFAPSLRLLCAHPSARSTQEITALSAGDLRAVDLVMTSYGCVQRMEWFREQCWDLVILDEAQAVKNPAAKQTRAVKALRGRGRIVLTGTPVENRVGDLWSLFDFINPGLLGSSKAFGQLTKKMVPGDGPANFGPLRRLIGPYILRRKKSDPAIISDLPDKTEVKAFCNLSRTQAAIYQQTVDELRGALAQIVGMKRRGVVLASLMRLKQICNHPAQWLRDGDWATERSGKLPRVREICEAIAAKQEKVLVFTQFREMTAPLSDFLQGVFGRRGVVLHGEMPVKDRKAMVVRFQEDEDVPYFVLSVKAGGTGLNLTAASHVIHYDRWWNPAVEDQATDRAYRIGQRRNVLVHKLVCRGTVEEKIDLLIESKQGLSRELLDGSGEVLLTEMSNEALLELVSLDIHRAIAEA